MILSLDRGNTYTECQIGMETDIHTARTRRLIHKKIMGDRTCFPTSCMSPKQKGTLCVKRTMPLFPPVCRESEQENSLYGRKNKNCPV